MTTRLWRLAVTVPNETAADAVSALLELTASAVSAFETGPGQPWLVQAFSERLPNRNGLEAGLSLAAQAMGMAELALEIEPMPEIDWLKRNQESFPPMRIGRFFVYGSHIGTPPPSGSVPLRIDAASAFGTGEHATTKGCLLALDRLARSGPRRHVLDMGSGTGILAIAAARLWRRPVLACDIDHRSVAVALENVGVNQVGGLVVCRRSDGYRHSAVRTGRPYDLIFANILARPLVAMAPSLARHLAPGGVAILSGLLRNQAAFVTAAHVSQGLNLYRRIEIAGWVTLVFRTGGGAKV